MIVESIVISDDSRVLLAYVLQVDAIAFDSFCVVVISFHYITEDLSTLLITKWANEMNHNTTVLSAASIESSKAFGRVDHNVICKKALNIFGSYNQLLGHTKSESDDQRF